MEALIVGVGCLAFGGLLWLLVLELGKQQRQSAPVFRRVDSGLRYRRPRARAMRPAEVHPAWVLGGILALSIFSQSLVPNSNQGTGFGSVDDRNLQNFPPPQQYQEIGGAQSAITYLNGSPDTLQITLTEATSGERLVFNFPGCSECKTYSRNDTSECKNIPGVQRTFTVPAGQYKARAIFLGLQNTRGFKSEWVIAPGWDYHQCIVTLNEVSYY